MSQINAHKVLKGTVLRNGFKDNIAVPAGTEALMRHRRDIIRQHVRAGIANWDNRIEKRTLFESYVSNFSAANIPSLNPKFRMQGSQVYRTANDPAMKPPQELDLDDGLFLPVAFFEKHGAINPLVASKGLFALVEGVLAPLCRREGWELVTTKSTCLRVRFGDSTHYDLPLYAVSDGAFTQLIEKRRKLATDAADFQAMQEQLDFEDSMYRELDKSDIRLAHRDKGWIDSDPRQLEQWFLHAIEIHGEQLRRICKYLKAWRDYQWQDCKLSSIALMACAVKAYDEMGGYIAQSRDDVALLEVVQRLPDYLNGVINNPVPGKPALNEEWDFNMRYEYVNRARELRRKLNEAAEIRNSKLRILKCYEYVFGSRIPDDESLIAFEPMISQVKQYQPAKTPQPKVRRSTSG